jgi:plastocyanin
MKHRGIGRAVALAGTGVALAATAVAGLPAAASAASTRQLTLVARSDTEHGRKGADGKWHDAMLPASFTVAPGQRVEVTVYNHDDGAHTFTAPTLGVNAKIPGGTEKSPHVTHFTFRAPMKAGRYLWYCMMPCDPYSMAHVGFMRGYVTVS